MSNPLASWLGSGGVPVPRTEAERRSQICIGCPKNVQPGWWNKMTKDPVAEAIRIALEFKNSMDMSVPDEDRLGMCEACGCCGRLHVWAPMNFIHEHTLEETMNHFADGCWITENLK